VEKYGKAGQATDENTIPRMRFACWITNAAKYVTPIDIPQQHLLRESAFVLRYICLVCLIIT
jgi:hypothetical protein